MEHFCTCTDHSCPNHPVNHEQGCDRCVRKCLALHEIPACFFLDVSTDCSQLKDYKYADFCEHYALHKSGDDA